MAVHMSYIVIKVTTCRAEIGSCIAGTTYSVASGNMLIHLGRDYKRDMSLPEKINKAAKHQKDIFDQKSVLHVYRVGGIVWGLNEAVCPNLQAFSHHSETFVSCNKGGES